MTAIYIFSDEASAGKTALAVTLASLLRREGASVVVVHPFDDIHDEYYAKLLGQAGNGASPASLSDPMDRVADSCRQAAEECDILIVEGSTSIGIESARELVDALDAGVVGITQHDHGKDANDLSEWSSTFGDRLIGVVVNGRTEYQGTAVTTEFVPALEGLGIQTLGVVPEDRKLVSSSIDQIVEHLDGRYLQGDEYGDRIIEHFLVGGMGLDSGTLYFGIREDKAVIVRGDRPDIQMAALHTPTSCLIMTNGTEPVEYIVHEAELEEAPIVIVDTDTLDTMKALRTLQDGVRFDHPDKVERFEALLRENVDLGAIFERLGVGVAA
ncbi:MAG: DRTGG domain-containing protein [Chloroflexi bacterium]|nr:DRTGG domain-containing protein [Chloroflexota bacterium]